MGKPPNFYAFKHVIYFDTYVQLVVCVKTLSSNSPLYVYKFNRVMIILSACASLQTKRFIRVTNAFSI